MYTLGSITTIGPRPMFAGSSKTVILLSKASTLFQPSTNSRDQINKRDRSNFVFQFKERIDRKQEYLRREPSPPLLVICFASSKQQLARLMIMQILRILCILNNPQVLAMKVLDLRRAVQTQNPNTDVTLLARCIRYRGPWNIYGSLLP